MGPFCQEMYQSGILLSLNDSHPGKKDFVFI